MEVWRVTQSILIAEDEMIVAFDLCNTVEEAGYVVEGPYAGISSAMLAFQKNKPDLAILDVSLHDGKAFELARTLAADHVPIIFHTGSLSTDEVTKNFPDVILLEKPCPPADVLRAVNTALANAVPSHAG